MPEARIRSVRELRCGVWEVDIIDASRKRLRRRFRAESEDGARAAALASLPGPKACTLAEALDRYFEIIAVKGTARKTIANYRKECRALGAIAGCAVDSISPAAAACSLESAESRGVSRVRCYRLKTICAAAGRHATGCAPPTRSQRSRSTCPVRPGRSARSPLQASKPRERSAHPDRGIPPRPSASPSDAASSPARSAGYSPTTSMRSA